MFEDTKLARRYRQWIWERDPRQAAPIKRRGIYGARMAHVLVRDFSEGQLTLRAMSLVYTTLLSLVPLLAVSFSVLKAFGVHNQVEPLLLNLLAPLGEQGFEISERIIEFVDNVRAGILGSLGLAFLIYTVISLIQKVERSFNYTWHVSQHRRFTQRFSDYLSVIVIGPVLMFSALGLTASISGLPWIQQLSAMEPLSWLVRETGRLVPYLLIILAFTFMYMFIPNTKVRLRSALLGAAVGGLGWQLTGWIFASLVVSSAKYTAIYSAFATLILFMIWLYLSWLVLLIGASVAFYHQHPEYIRLQGHDAPLSNRLKERLALVLAALIGRRHYQGGEPVTEERLARRLGAPMDQVTTLLQLLIQRGLVACTTDEPPAFLPARAPDTVPLGELLQAIRTAGEVRPEVERHWPHTGAVDGLLHELDMHCRQALEGRSWKDLALGNEDGAGPGDTALGAEMADVTADPERGVNQA